MTDKKDTKKTSNSEDPFDPQRREDDAPENALEPQPDLPASFAPIPSGQELNAAGRESLGDHLPESVIRSINLDKEEVVHSTRTNLQEHMQIGCNFARFLDSVETYMIRFHGDTLGVCNRTRGLVYTYLAYDFGSSKSWVRLYIRCFQKFGHNSRATQTLSLSDMSMMVSNDIGDDVIDMVIEAKANDPNLSKRDIKKLIGIRRDQMSGANAQDRS